MRNFPNPWCSIEFALQQRGRAERLPQQIRARHRTLSSRRHHRCRHPYRCAGAGEKPGPAVRRRQPSRRQQAPASSEQGPAERGAGTRLRDATVKLAGGASSLIPAPCASPGSDPKGDPLPPGDAPRLRDENVRESGCAPLNLPRAQHPSAGSHPLKGHSCSALRRRLGVDLMSKAAPDGYTLCTMIAAHAANQTLYAKLPPDVGQGLAAGAG